MMKKLAKAALLAAATAFLLAGFPACSSDDDDDVYITDDSDADKDSEGDKTEDEGDQGDKDDESEGDKSDEEGDGEEEGSGEEDGDGEGEDDKEDDSDDDNKEDDSDDNESEGEKEPGEATTATVTVAEGFVDRTTNDFSYRPTTTGTAAGGDVLGEVPGFKLALADGTSEYKIESSNKATPDDSNYKLVNRLKLGGNAKFENGTVQQALVVTAEKPCMVTFYVRSSGSAKANTFQPFAADGTKLIENMAANVNPEGNNDLTYVVSFNMTSGTCYFGASEGGPGVCGVDVKFTE